MKTRLQSRLHLALAAALAISVSARGVDRFEIDYARDPKLLPYTFVEEQSNDWGVRKKSVSNSMQVYQAQGPESDTALIVHAFNPDLNRDDPAVFSFSNFTQRQVIDHDPVYVTITGFGFYQDHKAGRKSIIGGCYRNDSAFAIRIIPGTDRYDLLYLISGVDQTGNGEWEAGVAHVLTEDYDYDGRDEVIMYVGPGRDLRPRVLYCLEPENLIIEWSLPVAAPVSVGNLHSCRDSLDPSVMFATYNVKNGVHDENFTDNYCYLTKVNSRGEIQYNRILSEEHGSKGIWPGEADTLFYVFHAFPMLPPEDTTYLPPHRYQFSKIHRDGRVIKSIDIADRVRKTWLDDYDNNGNVDVYTFSLNGVIRIFDTDLNLLAESNATNLNCFLDTIRVVGQSRHGFLFRSGDGMELYSHDFKRLANLSCSPARYHPLVFDQQGNVTHFIITMANEDHVIRIRRKDFSDIARILFYEWRGYILATMCLLLLALVIVNAYRQKARRRLAESDKQLRSVVENAEDVFYRIDMENRVVWISPSVTRLLGYGSLDEIIGRDARDFYVDPGKRQALLDELHRTGRVTEFEVELRRQDGSTVVVSANSGLYRDDDGNVAGVEGVFRDITRRKQAEEALKDERDFVRSLLDTANSLIVCLDRQARITVFNTECERVTGYTRDEVIGKNWADIFLPEGHYHHSLKDFAEWVRQHPRDTYEGPLKTKSGLIRTILWSNSALFSDDSEELTAIAVGQDITQRKEADLALKESEEKYRLLVQNVRAAIAVVDFKGEFLFVNEVGARAHRKTAEEIIGSTMWDLFPREVADQQMRRVREVIETEKEFVGESRTFVDGEWRWYSMNLQPFRDAQGTTRAAMVIGYDVTERKKAEEALRSSEAHYRALFENANDAIFLENENEEIVDVNRRACQLTGYTREELLRMKTTDLEPPELRALPQLPIYSNPDLPVDASTERSLLLRDGTQIPTELTITSLKVGEQTLFLSILRDVSERKEAQKQLQLASQERYEQVKRMAGGIAHEIYNALFPATSSLSKLNQRLDLRSADDVARNRKLLELCEQAIQRAVDMTGLVTEYSKLESKKKKEDVPLRELLEEIIKANELRIEQLGVEITLDIPDDYVLEMYRLHAYSLFSNLVVNALDALEEVGDRRIRVVAATEGDRQLIEFADTGPGIADEHIPKIFNAFYSTKPTTGTGLGLAMVRKIVELYGGEVAVESSIDKGARFVILLERT